MACPAAQYFAPLLYKGHDLRKKNVIEHKISVLIFSTTFPEKILIQRRTEQDIKNVY